MPTEPGPESGRSWTWLIPAALGAGLLAWALGEPALAAFTPDAQELKSGLKSYVATDNTPYLRAIRRVAIRNAALHEAIWGGVLGLALGLAGGLSRRSARDAVVAAGSGALVGGVSAGAAALALVPLFLTYYRQDQPHLFLPLLVHGGTWAAVGASGGLAWALGRGGRGRPRAASIAGGMAGAALGTAAFEVLYAVAFPLARGESPIPSEPAGRLLAPLLIALAIALGIVVSSASGSRKRSPGI